MKLCSRKIASGSAKIVWESQTVEKRAAPTPQAGST